VTFQDSPRLKLSIKELNPFLNFPAKGGKFPSKEKRSSR
jgi:hypothetical protein